MVWRAGQRCRRGHAFHDPVVPAPHLFLSAVQAARDPVADGNEGPSGRPDHAALALPPARGGASCHLQHVRRGLRRAHHALDRQRSAQGHCRPVRRHRADHAAREGLADNPRRAHPRRSPLLDRPRRHLYHPPEFQQGLHLGRRAQASRPAGRRAPEVDCREGRVREARVRHPRRGRVAGRSAHLGRLQAGRHGAPRAAAYRDRAVHC
eukprot:Amastigsp_a339963_1738.p3 type:complete len:208 gc:universal Amastigsp_a339963_1738:722-99(-)